jgi:hypothetical protein
MAGEGAYPPTAPVGSPRGPRRGNPGSWDPFRKLALSAAKPLSACKRTRPRNAGKVQCKPPQSRYLRGAVRDVPSGRIVCTPQGAALVRPYRAATVRSGHQYPCLPPRLTPSRGGSFFVSSLLGKPPRPNRN